MKTVTMTELRRHGASLLALVEQGETIRVLRRGRLVGHIVPQERTAQQPSWKRHGLRLPVPGVRATEAIPEERRATV